MPISSLTQIPFVERDPWTLFGLDPTRTTVDEEHVVYGWCRLDELRLEDAHNHITVVACPLVLGLHSRDDAGPLPNDIELEFIMRDDGKEYSCVALLSDILHHFLPAISSPTPAAVVLAISNCQGATLSRPPALANVPLYFAHGEVTAWMERRAGNAHWRRGDADIILAGERWLRI